MTRYAAICDGRLLGDGVGVGGEAEGEVTGRWMGMDLEGRGRDKTATIAVLLYGQPHPRSNINSTRQGAPNLRKSADAFRDPWASERDTQTTICVGAALATSMRAGFGRCFDGETEPRCLLILKAQVKH